MRRAILLGLVLGSVVGAQDARRDPILQSVGTFSSRSGVGDSIALYHDAGYIPAILIEGRTGDVTLRPAAPGDAVRLYDGNNQTVLSVKDGGIRFIPRLNPPIPEEGVCYWADQRNRLECFDGEAWIPAWSREKKTARREEGWLSSKGQYSRMDLPVALLRLLSLLNGLGLLSILFLLGCRCPRGGSGRVSPHHREVV